MVDLTVCDDTQNLNETESETFFRYQILPIPNPILFPIPNIFNTESDTFFDTKFFRYRIRNHLKNGKVSKPRSFETETSPKIPKIWTKPNRTVSMYHQCIFWDCFALQKLRILLLEVISVWRYPKSERNRIRNFFRYQIFPIPNPILFSIPNFYDTESDTFFDTKFFRYRIRNHQKNGKVSKPRSFETETSHSDGYN